MRTGVLSPLLNIVAMYVGMLGSLGLQHEMQMAFLELLEMATTEANDVRLSCHESRSITQHQQYLMLY